MPIIPAIPSVVTGTALSASDVFGGLFTPADPPVSMDILNGWLDDANMAQVIEREQIRPGSITWGKMVGQTAHYDLLDSCVETSSDETRNYVPGGCMTFYVPRVWSWLITTFQIVCAGDEDITNDPPNMFMRFFVDGSAVLPQRRWLKGSLDIGSGNRYPRNDRIWSGHHDLTGLSVGWHSIGIAIYHSLANRQMRARIRNIKLIGIR